MNADDAERLNDLERENATLKRLLADAELEKAALKEFSRGSSNVPLARTERPALGPAICGLRSRCG
jgi:hypothetical protein